MDNRAEVREFMVSRRAKVTPEQAGLPAGERRRVPGLRRSEVAALAGVSIEYYSKIERGDLGGVSPSVLDGIARALQLDPAERAHLIHLAQAADGSSELVRPRRPTTKRWTVRPSLQWTLDAITTAPAIVGNGHQDLLATNRLGRAFYDELFTDPRRPPNFARFAFLDGASHRFYPNWELAADTSVAILRCTTSWENCRPAVTSSADGGVRTTFAFTVPGSSTSTTTSSATSASPTSPSTSSRSRGSA
jgi:transcriptional regulator with XRE-family HTH domain